MALIGEAAGHGDLRQGCVGSRRKVASVFDAFASQEFSDGAREVPAELARQVHAMHPSRARDLRQTQRAQEVGLQVFARDPQPPRKRPHRTRAAHVPSGLGEHLQQNPLERDRRQIVALLEFVI